MADPNVTVVDGTGVARRAVLVSNLDGEILFQENANSTNAMVRLPDGSLHRVMLVANLADGGGGGGGGDYLPLSGGELTGDLTLFGSNPQDIKRIIITYETSTTVVGGYITSSGQGLEFGRIKGDSNSALFTMTYGLGLFPNGDYSLGVSAHPWSSTYTKKLNNGADLAVPTEGGTLARVEDIDAAVGDISTALTAILGE